MTGINVNVYDAMEVGMYFLAGIGIANFAIALGLLIAYWRFPDDIGTGKKGG